MLKQIVQMKLLKMRPHCIPKVKVGSLTYRSNFLHFHNFEVPCFIIIMVGAVEGSIIFVYTTWNNVFLILFYM